MRKNNVLARSPRRGSISNTQAVIGSDRKYAAIHQLGGKTAAHKIRPKRKKALAFGGGVYKSVNHPGSKIPARPFFPWLRGRPTRGLVKRIERAVKRVLERKVL